MKVAFHGRTMKHEIQNTTESIIGIKLGYHLLNNVLIDIIIAQTKRVQLPFFQYIHIRTMINRRNAGF